MVRVKRGVAAHKRRKLTLRHTKGFMWGRKAKYRLAKEALLKAWKYSFRDRKTKKRAFRRLWEVQLNAALKPMGISYSKFIFLLKQHKIELDRKILSTLAKIHPQILQAILTKINS